MQLPSAGREYARITFSAFTPSVSLVASVDGFATTLPVVIGADGIGRVLLRGPTFVPQVGDATSSLLVPSPGATLAVRATDSPELVQRVVGEVDIT